MPKASLAKAMPHIYGYAPAALYETGSQAARIRDGVSFLRAGMRCLDGPGPSVRLAGLPKCQWDRG